MKIERLPELLWGATTCWVAAISATVWNRSWRAREGTFVYILKAVTACWSQIKLSSSYSSVSVPETVFPSAFDLIFFNLVWLFFILCLDLHSIGSQ